MRGCREPRLESGEWGAYASLLAGMFFMGAVFFDKIGVFETVPWADSIVHFSAGFLVAGLYTHLHTPSTPMKYFYQVMLVVGTIGIAWEIVEGVGLIGNGFEGWYEAIKDLCVDSLGAYLFVWIRRKGG